MLDPPTRTHHRVLSFEFPSTLALHPEKAQRRKGEKEQRRM
jgi:hypothetical protein